MGAEPRYRAFISYSWQDKVWGRRIHSWLETYNIPKAEKNGAPLPKRLGRIFRDDADMPAASNIGDVVAVALAEAEAMIVVCSPRSARSKWVNSEVSHFRRLPGPRKVYAVIIDGTPNSGDPETECFPPALRAATDPDDPEAMPIEPVGLDVRRDGRDRICARLAAGLLDIDFDDLWGRDRRRAERRSRQRLAALSVLTAVFAGLLTLSVINGVRAHLALSRFFAERAWQKLADGDAPAAARYALAGLRIAPQNKPLFEAALGGVMQASGESAAPLEAGGATLGLNVAATGDRFVTAGADGAVRLWRFGDAAPLAIFKIAPGPLAYAMISRDGSKIAAAGTDGALRVFDAKPGAVARVLSASGPSFAALAFSPDGANVLTARENGAIDLWRDGAASALAPAGPYVWAAAFSPDGARIAVARDDGTIPIVNVQSGAIERVVEAGEDAVLDVAFSPDGARIATGDAVVRLRVWRLSDGRRLVDVKAHAYEIYRVRFAPEGARIATAGTDQAARIWSAQTGARIAEFTRDANVVNDVAFSSDGQRIATAGEDHVARLWDARSGKLLAAFQGHADAVIAARFAADGRTVATLSADGAVRLWPGERGRDLARIAGHDHAASVEFAPGGAALVSAGRDGAAKIWDVRTGALRATLKGHESGVRAAFVAHNGLSVATAGEDGSVAIWDFSGRLLRSWRAH
ncbi:MAG: TIR domain-containing protein, partial [Alphaproteobacteria bacterium]|nr:TIR domain-containing protein [Alphaproteobacteria bacterium]